LAKNQSAQVTQIDGETLVKIQGLKSIERVITTAIPWLGAAVIAAYGFHALEFFAGRQSDASVVVKLMANKELLNVVSMLCGGGGVAYGWKQRSLRKSAIEHLEGPRRDSEIKADPNRTSSHITRRGDTHPEDE